MEIDKKTIKALAADRRIDILKSLKQRRKMPSELSRELNLAASTVVEHLNILEDAGLVVRKETGRKWIYYELTDKGEGLIAPRFPVQFVLMLALGMVFVFTGFARYFFGFTQMLEQGQASGAIATTAGGVTVATPDYLLISLFVLGAALILFSGYKILRR